MWPQKPGLEEDMLDTEKLLRKVSHWWEGEFVHYENDPNSPGFIIGGYQKLHWTARAVRLVWEFYQEHWKWLWGTCIAIAAIVVAAN